MFIKRFLHESNLQACGMYICMVCACRIDDQQAEAEERSKEERLKQLWDSFKQNTK